MIRVSVLLLLATGLAACGADGEPIQPQVSQSVTLSSSGVSASTGLSLRKGPVTLSVSL